MNLHDECARRTALDGIPRCVTDDGRIMKYDWEFTPDGDEDFEALEAHIAKLMKELADDSSHSD